MTPEPYFPFRSEGTLRVDPGHGTKHFEPWWALVACDDQIVRYYGWLLKRRGCAVDFNRLWGAHISAVKGAEPLDKGVWCGLEGRAVEFWYSNQIRTDNGVHAWLDVFSPDLAAVRRELGVFDKIFFHLTLGRLK